MKMYLSQLQGTLNYTTIKPYAMSVLYIGHIIIGNSIDYRINISIL